MTGAGSAPVKKQNVGTRQGSRSKPGLFDDEPPPAPDCARDGHVWRKDVMTWPGETIERLIWRCVHCPEIRGRC